MKETVMKHRTAVLLVFFALTLQTVFAQGLTQQTESFVQRKFSILPYVRKEGCHPAEIKAISMGAVPPDALTTMIAIKSFSDKAISALKVRWDIYQWDIGTKRQRSDCNVAADPTEIVLSGTTQLIDVGRLVKGETYTITSNPPHLQSPFPSNRVVQVDWPIIGWDQLKPLAIDSPRRVLKDDYMGLIYVSEIHFEDGTRWEPGK
jgi:hypothetical protein